MATKTISIDTDAYKRLKGVQRENESFSEVIKRVVWQPVAFEKMLKQRAKDPLSEEAVAAVEEVVARRDKPRKLPRRRRA
jgi:predicted CopG family antitoxin